jgi:hypothetical protein
VQLVLGGERHELVVGGVEVDLVDAVAEAVDRPQLRRMLVGLVAPGRQRRAAPDAADLGAALARPAAALAVERLDERDVRGEQVEVRERDRLVGDLVGDEGSGERVDRHVRSLDRAGGLVDL